MRRQVITNRYATTVNCTRSAVQDRNIDFPSSKFDVLDLLMGIHDVIKQRWTVIRRFGHRDIVTVEHFDSPF